MRSFLNGVEQVLLGLYIIRGDNVACEPRIDSMPEYPCYGTMQFTCPSASFNIGKTQFVKCDKVDLFWSYNVGNLTMTIETESTQQRKPFEIVFDNGYTFRNQMPHFYRIINGKQTEIISKDEQIPLASDGNYQIILKFQAPKKLQFYGASISYTIKNDK